MFWFVVGIIAAIAVAIACSFVKKENGRIAQANPKMLLAILPLIVFTVIACIKTVPTGNTGIVTTFGNVENYTYEAGIHFAAPWQEVVNMDNRTQRESVEMSAFSSDIQEVSVTYTINYQINKKNAQDIYKTIGTDYLNVVIMPKTQEAVKSVIAKYNAESLVESRGTLSAQIEERLTTELERYNIELSSTSLENLDFTDTFTDAVEAKQVAEQNKLKAQTEAEQAVIEAQAEADKKVIAAKAEADAALIAAENDVDVQKLAADAAEYAGEKTAAVNKRIAESITPELNDYYLIEAWKAGADVPDTVVGDADITSFLNLGGNTGKTK